MSSRNLFIWLVILLLIAGGIVYLISKTTLRESRLKAPTEKKLKACWMYIGPIGDYGWTHAHEMARQYVAKEFPWLETEYAEGISADNAPFCIDKFVKEDKCDVIFATSYDFMNATLAAAKKYPNKIFFHCSGDKRAPNLGTYFADFLELYYLNGLMAGALTKTNEIGYVGAFPTPEVVRHINAYALGAKEVNPKVKVDVRWLFSWYNPEKARIAAESLVKEGCDALAMTEDSPTVLMVGEENTRKGNPVYTFSHYSPMQKFAENSCVSGELVHWEVIYKDILEKIHNGTYTNRNLSNVDYWWMLKDRAVELGGKFGVPINPKFIPILKEKWIKHPVFGRINVYDLVMRRLSQMKHRPSLFNPFTGPIYDQNNNLKIASGRKATHDELWTMNWFVDNVIGKIPKEQ